MNYGEIYKMTNKVNNKSYIGQAKKYMGELEKEWGTNGRCDSHFREAISGKKDHCRLLNNAIRKYGKNNFECTKICDCLNKKDMDEKEKIYIKQFNTLTPNGYNLNEGGFSGKDNIETKEKKKKSHIGKKHSEQTKKYISKGQIGGRRVKKKRKYPEDESLPKYINARRDKNGLIIAYSIDKFPIGITEKKYINKSFKIPYLEDPKLILQDTIKYLDELKVKYSYIQEEIKKLAEEREKERIVKKKTEMQLKKLPEFIYPVRDPKTNKLIGYSVEGVLDNNKNPYPKKIFTDKTNRWNKIGAENHIKALLIKNEDSVFTIPKDYETSRRRKYDDDDNNLPKYVSIIRQKGEKIGYNIAIPSIIKPNGKRYTKKFANKKLSMEQKLNDCIKTLEQVKKEYNVTS